MFLASSATSSAFMREMQQILPSDSHVSRASLSPAFMPALSRMDLGRTICPRSSTVRRDSILQQWQPRAAMGAGGQHGAFLFLTVSFSFMVDAFQISEPADSGGGFYRRMFCG